MADEFVDGGSEASGCAGCLLALLVLGAVVFALISLAALVDPFSWIPTVGDVWADCEDDPATDRADCDLAARFPGFWWHAAVNLVYVAGAGALAVAFLGAVTDLREKRSARFSSSAGMTAYSDARGLAVGCGTALALIALLPIVVAFL
jgi:hypothetical protein